MTVESQEDVEALKKVGKIVALTIQEMRERVRPGMTTAELDYIGEQVLTYHGAVSAPKKLKNFPGAACISLNHEVAHGVPGERQIQSGDLINIDVSAELDGYYADAGYSFQLPPYNKKIVRLCKYTKKTMLKVISQLKHGVKLNAIGRMIQQEAKKGGYKVIQNLCSHGIGRELHEDPKLIVPYYDPKEKRVLKEGLVITIEPFLSTSANFVYEDSDGWTLKTPDKSYAAQYEHTIIITKQKPIILTH